MAGPSLVQPLTDLKVITGESPLWSVAEQALYWVDIKNPRVLRYNSADATVNSWPMPSEIGAICHAGRGRYVVSLRDGVMLSCRLPSGMAAALSKDFYFSINRSEQPLMTCGFCPPAVL